MNDIIDDIGKGLLDLSALTEIYFYANTPMYLYRNFKRNATVEAFASHYGFAELIDYFEKLISKERVDLSELICIYATVIALTFYDYYKTEFFFNKLDSYRLKWARELKYIILSSATSTEFISKKIKPKITITEEEK